MKTIDIDGIRIERLFLKMAINQCINKGRPIGSPDGSRGRPNDELVAMTFGRRPVVRPCGLWALPVPLRIQMPREEYAITPIGDEYFFGALIEFQSLCFAINFEHTLLGPMNAPPAFCRVATWHRSSPWRS